MRTIDLNCDLGERSGEAPLYRLVSSASVACGGHAGDAATMEEAVREALARGVAIGAHPSYPDRAGFGREPLPMEPRDLARSVESQILALREIASRLGAPLRHVKAHGALYNAAMRDRAIAEAVAEGAGRADASLALFGLAGSRGIEVWRGLGLRVVEEGFADRLYEADGTLRSRSLPGALVEDAGAAAAQAARLAASGAVATICVHSDTPGAERILAAVRRALEAGGYEIAPPAPLSRGPRTPS